MESESTDGCMAHQLAYTNRDLNLARKNIYFRSDHSRTPCRNGKTSSHTSKQIAPKYWKRRYILWSKYDSGIQMDTEAWYEVTPENVAKYTAWRLAEKRIVIDACSGVGGNSIQFAILGAQVYSVDVSRARMQMMAHNARIYGVEKSISCIQSDISLYLDTVSPDLSGRTTLYISPPWGGVYCYNKPSVSLEDLPFNLEVVLQKAWNKFGSFVAYLPRNFNFETLDDVLVSIGVNYCEVEAIIYCCPSPRIKSYLLYVDANVTSGASVLALRRDRARNTFSSFVSRGRYSNVLFSSYMRVNYLSRYIRTALDMLVASRVSYEPFESHLCLEIMEKNADSHQSDQD